MSTSPVIGAPPIVQPPALKSWVDQAYAILYAAQQSGTTANRPTKGLYVGRPYFDTTLTKPIWISAVSGSGVATWVDATGLAV